MRLGQPPRSAAVFAAIGSLLVAETNGQMDFLSQFEAFGNFLNGLTTPLVLAIDQGAQAIVPPVLTLAAEQTAIASGTWAMVEQAARDIQIWLDNVRTALLTEASQIPLVEPGILELRFDESGPNLAATPISTLSGFGSVPFILNVHSPMVGTPRVPANAMTQYPIVSWEPFVRQSPGFPISFPPTTYPIESSDQQPSP